MPTQHIVEPLLPSINDQQCAEPFNDNISNRRDRHRSRAFRDETIYSENDNENESCASNETVDSPHRNVTLVLLYTWVAFTGRGLWNQNCLATLVFLLKDGDTKAIGFLTAAMGMAQLCTSIPTGILADKYRRDILLKAGALVGIVAVGVSLRAALMPSYGVLLVALILWGIHWGIVNTCITALFSDSIPDGERSYYFTKRAVLINVANTCGPVIALVMFAVMGDNWTVVDCSRVLLAGNIVSLPGLLLLCWMRDKINDENDDDNDNDNDDASNGERPSSNGDETIASSDCDANSLCPLELTAVGNINNLEEPLLPQDTATAPGTSSGRLEVTRNHRTTPSRSLSSVDNTTTFVERTADTHQDESYDEEKLRLALSWLCCWNTRIVPSLIGTTDVISGFASGMSIRYIAIFLYDNLGLSPIAVQVVYIITPILQVFLRKKAQIMAKTYGRCRVTVALKWIGISLMVAMVVLYNIGAPTVVVCLVLILRTCFMNSPSSLTKSILMDHVPKEERAKWASLESVSMVSWSGSAALGGILVESNGILFNFSFTAFLQFLATGPLLLLSFYDDRNNDIEDNSNNDENHESRRTFDCYGSVDESSDENCSEEEQS